MPSFGYQLLKCISFLEGFENHFLEGFDNLFAHLFDFFLFKASMVSSISNQIF